MVTNPTSCLVIAIYRICHTQEKNDDALFLLAASFLFARMPCTHYTQCSFHSNEGPVQHRCVQQRLVQQVQCDPQGGLNSFGNRQEGLIHASRPTHSDLLNANYYLLNCTLHYFSHWRAIALDVSLLENCMTLAASI